MTNNKHGYKIYISNNNEYEFRLYCNDCYAQDISNFKNGILTTSNICKRCKEILFDPNIIETLHRIGGYKSIKEFVLIKNIQPKRDL